MNVCLWIVVLLRENESSEGFGRLLSLCLCICSFLIVMAFSLLKPLKWFSLMHQLKIVSIFLVWIWANISLQKSIPECLHSSSGLEACTSKCFWNDSSREKALCKWDLSILGDPSLVFLPGFYFTPPTTNPTTNPPSSLSSLNWSLWRSSACERAIFISFRVCDFVDGTIHTHTEEDANKQYEACLS